jgi:catechol 2,3-dioxygenase-like lactoylglutathione lyase family enzyme
MTPPFRISAADHTGFTVENIERSLEFWHGVLGFELSHRAHHTGDLASEVTGVAGAEILIAVLKAPGHRIELLEYLAPADRTSVSARPCDTRAAHIALVVDDLDAALASLSSAGSTTAGTPHTLVSGPNAGRRVVYIRSPDGITIELIQPPRAPNS